MFHSVKSEYQGGRCRLAAKQEVHTLLEIRLGGDGWADTERVG